MGKRLAVSDANLKACPCAKVHGNRTGKAMGRPISVEPCPCHYAADWNGLPI